MRPHWLILAGSAREPRRNCGSGTAVLPIHMPARIHQNIFVVTLYTLAIGVLGAMLARALSFPAWILIGPALAVSIAGLSGLKLGVADQVRDTCFVVLGIGIGTGFDPQTGGALLRWPMAFVVLAVMLLATMALCRSVLIRVFDMDARSASLAASPGHLSFVLSLAADLNIDVARITIIQSIRLLFLTVSVPFIAAWMGYNFTSITLSRGDPMAIPVLIGLSVAAVVSGFLFRRLRFPAPLLLGGMAVSAFGHVSEMTPGAVPDALLLPSFLVLGTLIGTRFAGMERKQFFGSLMAGLSTTLISVVIAVVAAVPVAMVLEMPTAHVLAAFAPGGLETMIALGATMGASPGFVAACHVARLLILLVLIPLFLGRRPS